MNPSATPTNKVLAGALAGALAAILTWVVKTFAHQDVPAEIGVAVSTVITFAVQYMVPDSNNQPPKENP